MSYQQLAEELHKPIISKFEKSKVYSSFKDNIWSADLVDMQLMTKFNKGFHFLLSVNDIDSKYAWVVSLKNKNGITIKVFSEILVESDCKRNKVWVDKGREFYNRSLKSCLRDNDIKMCWVHNEGKSVVAEKLLEP